jgi:hypothetical protein
MIYGVLKMLMTCDSDVAEGSPLEMLEAKRPTQIIVKAEEIKEKEPSLTQVKVESKKCFLVHV